MRATSYQTVPPHTMYVPRFRMSSACCFTSVFARWCGTRFCASKCYKCISQANARIIFTLAPYSATIRYDIDKLNAGLLLRVPLEVWKLCSYFLETFGAVVSSRKLLPVTDDCRLYIVTAYSKVIYYALC